MEAMFLFITSVVFGYQVGWYMAHAEIARECKLLGGFYVGKTIYKCHEIKKETP